MPAALSHSKVTSSASGRVTHSGGKPADRNESFVITSDPENVDCLTGSFVHAVFTKQSKNKKNTSLMKVQFFIQVSQLVNYGANLKE